MILLDRLKIKCLNTQKKFLNILQNYSKVPFFVSLVISVRAPVSTIKSLVTLDLDIFPSTRAASITHELISWDKNLHRAEKTIINCMINTVKTNY